MRYSNISLIILAISDRTNANFRVSMYTNVHRLLSHVLPGVLEILEIQFPKKLLIDLIAQVVY